MAPWWGKSSSKEAKTTTSGGGIFGLFKRKLKGPCESKEILSQRRSEMGYKVQRPHTHPPPRPENLSDTRRVDLGKWVSRNPKSNKVSSPLFVFPLLESDISQNGHGRTDDEILACESPLLSYQELNYVTANKYSANNPSSHVTQKKTKKMKQVNTRVSNQMSPTTPKWHPSSRHMANLQIPQSGGFINAPNSSKSTPKSSTKVSGPEPTKISDFWAMRPHTDTGFHGPGLCLTQDSSPIPSPGPKSTLQSGSVTPLHPSVGGPNLNSSANWPDDGVNGKQQTHRLPHPPLTASNTGPSSPAYLTRTAPSIPKSPGRADLSVSRGSGWKKGRLLGRGSFGDVYLGFNIETGEMCAMKEATLYPDDPRSIESAKQLMQEIAVLGHLKHPNIVQCYGSETVGDKLYIYLEYVSGGSIYKLLKEHGAFGEDAITNYTRQILSGLAYLHSTNTVHRDIKGANILVEPDGCIKLADFGMAKQGSQHWMAPEIINDNSNGCNIVVDIWSLGCTILEMATTISPWTQHERCLSKAADLFNVGSSGELDAIPNHLSADAKDFIFQCMQRAPSCRPTATQLLQHPFVKNVPPSQRFPRPITNAMESLGIGHASEGVTGHIPHNIRPLNQVSRMGNPLRAGQNMNRRLSSLSPIARPRAILGPPRPLIRAAVTGPGPNHHQMQRPYTPEFTGLTLTSRSPARSFGPPSHAVHILDLKLDNDFERNPKKHLAGKSVLVDHGSKQVSKHHMNRNPPVNIKRGSPVVGRKEHR